VGERSLPEQLRLTAQTVEANLGHGDQVAAPRPIDHEAAAAFTREILAIVDRHGGHDDGWGGFLVPPDDDTGAAARRRGG
jgi:hypothetical protein